MRPFCQITLTTCYRVVIGTYLIVGETGSQRQIAERSPGQLTDELWFLVVETHTYVVAGGELSGTVGEQLLVARLRHAGVGHRAELGRLGYRSNLQWPVTLHPEYFTPQLTAPQPHHNYTTITPQLQGVVVVQLCCGSGVVVVAQLWCGCGVKYSG